jgi:hypothetical protein
VYNIATEVCAELNTFVPGRKLEDDGVVLIRFNFNFALHLYHLLIIINYFFILFSYEGGARCMLAASQIAAGEGNDLFISLYLYFFFLLF